MDNLHRRCGQLGTCGMGAFDGVRRQRSLAFVVELVDRGVAYLAPDCHTLSAGQPVASSGGRSDPRVCCASSMLPTSEQYLNRERIEDGFELLGAVAEEFQRRRPAGLAPNTARLHPPRANSPARDRHAPIGRGRSDTPGS